MGNYKRFYKLGFSGYFVPKFMITGFGFCKLQKLKQATHGK